MPLTNAGRDFIAKAIIDDSPTPFDNTNAYIGAGDSTATFAAAQTDLQASTNKLRKGMEAGYPQRTGNVLTFRALFGTGEGNFAWGEWGIFNHASAGEMLSRIVESLGTKENTQSWQFTVDITVAIG